MTGRGYGCDNCYFDKVWWTDLETIEEGFPCDRTMEKDRAIWASLRKRADGEVFKVDGDFETRKGLSHEPVALRDPTSFTVTHKVAPFGHGRIYNENYICSVDESCRS